MKHQFCFLKNKIYPLCKINKTGLQLIYYRLLVRLLPVIGSSITGYGFIFYLKDITGTDNRYYELDITVYGFTKYLITVPVSCVSFYLIWIIGLDILYYLISKTGHWFIFYLKLIIGVGIPPIENL